MLYVEGRADRVLGRRLGVPGREIGNGEDKGGVLRLLLQQRDCNGLVDEDPTVRPPGLMDRFVEVSTDDLAGLGLRLYRHGERGSTLVVLCPRLEEWIIAAARDAGLRLDNRRYALPADAEHLHDAINNDLRKLDRLLNDLLSAQSPRLLRLQALITE